MPVAHGIPTVRRTVELFRRILSQQLVDFAASCERTVQQRLVDQAHQLAQRDAGHLLCCLPRETTPKDRQPCKPLLLSLCKQIPRMAKDGADAALPFRHIVRICLQEIEALTDLGGDLSRRQ